MRSTPRHSPACCLMRSDRRMQTRRRHGGRRALPSFNGAGAKVLALLQLTDRGLRLNRAATLRAEAAQRRTDSRGWVGQRRERTRPLIELGGLAQKAGLAALGERSDEARGGKGWGSTVEYWGAAE